jgi:hypothetical protein
LSTKFEEQDMSESSQLGYETEQTITRGERQRAQDTPAGLAIIALTAATNDIARAADHASFHDRAQLLAYIRQARRDLAGIEHDLERDLGKQMGERRVTVTGVGTLERHRDRSYRGWQTDDLLRAVLDTKLVDPETGEMVEETPLDKVRAVWNLGAPRLTALKDRGLQPDEFVDEVVDKGGWKIRLHESDNHDFDGTGYTSHDTSPDAQAAAQALK